MSDICGSLQYPILSPEYATYSHEQQSRCKVTIDLEESWSGVQITNGDGDTLDFHTDSLDAIIDALTQARAGAQLAKSARPDAIPKPNAEMARQANEEAKS